MSTAAATSELNHPIRTEPIPDGNPTWRDNAYVCFWDPQNRVTGVVHVSVSPNSPGRLRLSLGVAGETVEIIEAPDDSQQFRGPSIRYPLDDTISVANDRLRLELTIVGRFVTADYTEGQVIPPLVPGEPQHHVQEAVKLTGSVTFDGRTIEIAADGFRDRTWGYRDESHLTEYISFMAVLADSAFTALRFQSPSSDETDGFWVDEEGSTRITGIGVTRDASGLLAAADLTLADGETLALEAIDKRGGFWVPMGVERRGPSFSAYDELCEIELSDGRRGYAFVEHGVIRRLF